MTTIRTTQLSAHVGQSVRLRGWVQTLRLLGGINFLILRDGWGTVQAVTQDAADFAPLTDHNLAPETVIELAGIVVATPQAPAGSNSTTHRSPSSPRWTRPCPC